MKSMCCPTGGSWSDVSCATSCTSAREINDIQEAAGRASGSLRLAWVVLIFALLIVGCGKTTPPAAKPKASGNKIAEQLAAAPQQASTTKGNASTVRRPRVSPDDRARFDEIPETESEFDFNFGANSGDYAFQGGGSFSAPGKNESREGLSGSKIVERVTSLLRDSVDYGPTLAVWVIDESKSARGLVQTIGSMIQQPYSGLKSDVDPKRFLTAVCTFGGQVHFPVDSPSPDPSSLVTAINSMPNDPTGKEMVFTAIGEAIKKYSHFRTAERREVMFFIVTDESGDDQNLVDSLIEEPRRNATPIYVIGVPAPFGRVAALDPSVENASDKTSIRQGPESRYREHIELGFWGGMNDFRMMDSGFGPFALEKLCRGTSGRYIAVRPATSGYSFAGAMVSEWPSSGVWQPDPTVMQKYAPDYTTEAEYQKILQGNAACMALHEAAKVDAVEFTQLPEVTFRKENEPQLASDLARAQQLAAKLEPGVNRLYDALEKGESGRAKLTSPRWQAAYDVAMGRAAAAKSRVDGYNVMLAELKRGKNFERETSNTWELATAETTDATSALKKLGEKAKMYLERVVKEHPGTPWAKLAERELQTPFGWKWTER
ncbi:MAG: VWA domain-containing protein [Planctomycetaceae bacterium]|nr:VWA domain-containing protein [Planctomycetales bacterium]MCB9922670.1 VWA domain-containing protein [Planctomycetaceae bacterium]